ncbi:MAG: hypothetical protein M1820_007383 [Bogoriella megaspora]|nr:MAG: hypothetical protein M1820_007383 [Bogoriella megaspora]
MSTIAIFGTGSVGLAAAFAAKLTSPSHLIIIDNAEAKLKILPEGLFTSSLNSAGLEEAEIAKKLRAITNGQGFDFVIDCVGIAQLVNAGHQALASRGMVVTVGGSHDSANINISKQLVGGCMYRGTHQGDCVPTTSIPKMIDLWRQGKFPFDTLLTSYEFHELHRGLEELQRGRTIKPLFRQLRFLSSKIRGGFFTYRSHDRTTPYISKSLLLAVENVQTYGPTTRDKGDDILPKVQGFGRPEHYGTQINLLLSCKTVRAEAIEVLFKRINLRLAIFDPFSDLSSYITDPAYERTDLWLLRLVPILNRDPSQESHVLALLGVMKSLRYLCVTIFSSDIFSSDFLHPHCISSLLAPPFIEFSASFSEESTRLSECVRQIVRAAPRGCVMEWGLKKGETFQFWCNSGEPFRAAAQRIMNSNAGENTVEGSGA